MRIAPTIVALALIAGCGTSDETAEGATSGSTAEATTTTEQLVGESVEEVTGRPVTPAPDAGAAVLLEDEVASLYPGVPEGKTVDWARSTCSDMLAEDLTDDQIVTRTQQRFAGGDRPDPTPEQAAQIIQFIEAGEWCVPR